MNRIVPDCDALMLLNVTLDILLVSVILVLKNVLMSNVGAVENVVVVSDVNTTPAVNTLLEVPASKLLAVAPSIATDPDDVIVANDIPVPAATEVTVPPPAEAAHDVLPLPSVCSTWPLLPFVAGSWKLVAVPAAAAALTVTSPEVDPNILTLPRTEVFVPRLSAPLEIEAFVLVVGADPAPPPKTIWPEPITADEAIAVALEKYKRPPEVALPG